jgi:hypothetical protein
MSSISKPDTLQQFIEKRKTIVVSQSLATSPSFTINLRTTPYNLPFAPNIMIIRQLIYCNIGAGTDNGTYLIQTNIPNVEYLGAVYVGIQSVGLMPETEVVLPKDLQSIGFTVVPANTNFTGPTGHLVMTIEFLA